MQHKFKVYITPKELTVMKKKELSFSKKEINLLLKFINLKIVKVISKEE
jgi:Fe-S cluster assembly iron-binding protein IscA